MERFQIYLPTPMIKILRKMAEQQGISVAEVIRSMVQKQIEKEQK